MNEIKIMCRSSWCTSSPCYSALLSWQRSNFPPSQRDRTTWRPVCSSWCSGEKLRLLDKYWESRRLRDLPMRGNLKEMLANDFLKELNAFLLFGLWPSRTNLTLKSQNLPHFELVRTMTHYPFKLGSPNLDQGCKIAWLRSLLFWVAIDLNL